MTDQLPSGPQWIHEMVRLSGGQCDEDGKPMTDEMELYRRDPIECIRELIGNPAFNSSMAYAPTQVFRDKEGKVQVYDEMSTADWWWDIQVSLPMLRSKL